MTRHSPSEAYQWEIELADGTVVQEYEEGKEREGGWTLLPVESIVRVSIVPLANPYLPRHDCLIDHNSGETFVRTFGRGFMRTGGLAEYLQCVVTNRYRLWVFSSGQTLVTPHDYEVYL